MHNKQLKRSGFTLIELVIVVAILGLLAAALFVAIDPAKRLGEARDAQRWADVTAILNGVLNYTADVATTPAAVSSLTANVYYMADGDAVDEADTCAEIDDKNMATANLSFLVDGYLATIPEDPTVTNEPGYYIKRSTNGRITVGACIKSQATQSIEVTR